MARIGQRLYERVARRAKYRCEYRKLPQAAEVFDLTIDHVIPKSRGGRTEAANLALACVACNSRKWKFTHWYDPHDPEKNRIISLIRQDDTAQISHWRSEAVITIIRLQQFPEV